MPDFTNMKEVKELLDYLDVNEHLDDGWVLLAVHPNSPEVNQPYQNIYVIGKPKN